MNHEVQKSRVCLIRVLEAEDRDTEGKQTGENFLETTKHLSSAIKGPAGIKKRRHTPINLIFKKDRNVDNTYIYPCDMSELQEERKFVIFQRGKKQIIYQETRIQLTLLFTLKHGAVTSKF